MTWAGGQSSPRRGWSGERWGGVGDIGGEEWEAGRAVPAGAPVGHSAAPATAPGTILTDCLRGHRDGTGESHGYHECGNKAPDVNVVVSGRVLQEPRLGSSICWVCAGGHGRAPVWGTIHTLHTRLCGAGIPPLRARHTPGPRASHLVIRDAAPRAESGVTCRLCKGMMNGGASCGQHAAAAGGGRGGRARARVRIAV